jgi:hypothetical protein
MQFFILLPGDNEEDAYLETNLLGECSGFKTFWPGHGYHALIKIIQESPEYCSKITIINDKAKKYTIEEFLDFIKPFKIRSL